MTRYYALVLVPGDADTPEEEACEAAAELLYPYMRSEDDPEADHKFDWFLQPDDISGPDVQLIWRAGDIVERFPELEVEAILTPDGRWHVSEAEVWDDEALVCRARQILRQHQECLALRHVLHI
jgi:hypothetical protein